MTDVLHYAQLSDHIYDPAKKGPPVGWRIQPPFRNPNSGFYAALYRRESTGEAVLAFRGTESTDWGDIIADFGIVQRRLSAQFGDAMRAFLAMRTSLMRAGRPYGVLTGHSLGGALAKYVGALTGHVTYAFNAPGVSGMGAVSRGSNRGDIRNVNAVFDPVSKYGQSLGRTETVHVGVYAWVPDILEPVTMSAIYLLKQHAIDNLVAELASRSPSRRPFANG